MESSHHPQDDNGTDGRDREPQHPGVVGIAGQPDEHPVDGLIADVSDAPRTAGIGEVPTQPVVARGARRDDPRKRGDGREGARRDGRGTVSPHHDEVRHEKQRRQLQSRGDARHHSSREAGQRTGEVCDDEQPDQHVDLSEVEVHVQRVGPGNQDEHYQQHREVRRRGPDGVTPHRQPYEGAQAEERCRHPHDLAEAGRHQCEQGEEHRRDRWIGERQSHRRNAQRVEITAGQDGVAARAVHPEVDLIVQARRLEVAREHNEQRSQQDEWYAASVDPKQRRILLRTTRLDLTARAIHATQRGSTGTSAYCPVDDARASPGDAPGRRR